MPDTAETPKREYFFKKGNKFGAGQPMSSKKQMEIIRRRILRVVRHRIFREKDLSSVSTTDLLKFVATIMPKDYALAVRPEINYISTVPRDEELPAPTQDTLPLPEAEPDPDTRDDIEVPVTEPVTSTPL